MALKMQPQEQTTYDHMFVSLEAILLDFDRFRAFGAYIAECRGLYALNKYFVIAKGSTKSFQTGKSYKWCRKLHELLALAMEVLYLKIFINEKLFFSVDFTIDLLTTV